MRPVVLSITWARFTEIQVSSSPMFRRYRRPRSDRPRRSRSRLGRITLPIVSRKKPNEQATYMRRPFPSPLSPYTAKTRIALYDKGLEFEKINVLWDPVRGFAEKPREMLEINPKDQVLHW